MKYELVENMPMPNSIINRGRRGIYIPFENVTKTSPLLFSPVGTEKLAVLADRIRSRVYNYNKKCKQSNIDRSLRVRTVNEIGKVGVWED